jgi:hypothetical protein
LVSRGTPHAAARYAHHSAPNDSKKQLRDSIGALTATWSRLGHEIGFGIGIAHGSATLGTIGFEGRFDYAAIGTVSNCRLSAVRRSQAGSNPHQPPRVDESRERREGRAGRRVRVEGDQAAPGGVQRGWRRGVVTCARRKFAVALRLDRRDVSRWWMRSLIPSARPTACGRRPPRSQVLFLRCLAAKRSRASRFSRSSCSLVRRA